MDNCTASPALTAAAEFDGAGSFLLQTLVAMVALCLVCLVVGLLWLRSWLHSIQHTHASAQQPAAAAAAAVVAAAAATTAPAAVASESSLKLQIDGGSAAGGGCPFGYGAASGKSKLSTKEKHAMRMGRVTSLYEDYIHLHALRVVWANPVTDSPQMEPCFAAAMHSIELAFILMAEFIKDSRQYVVKRPRVELVAADVIDQCGLLAQIVDGELEDEANAGMERVRRSLIHEFPFEGAPPTLTQEDVGFGRQSPGLDMLIDAVSRSFTLMSVPERHSIIKVVRKITGTIDTSFSTWSVGIGWEQQLRQLRESVGLAPLPETLKREYLDYAVLVRPACVANTLLRENYRHEEDFFFRSVHLGTECWGFIVLDRLRSAIEQVQKYDHWQNAAAHLRSAAHILDYLGQHVMMLTSMVLRDYLRLKVEIEGTSGEGSSAVKSFRPVIESLFVPLADALLGGGDRGEDDELLKAGLLDLYEHPERQPGLYNYAKALEIVESSLLGGFYFRHFCLASNVIGSTAKGTMKKSVAALKKTYEKQLFPLLDITRSTLGAKLDAELVQFKGRIMDDIERQRRSPSPEALDDPFDDVKAVAGLSPPRVMGMNRSGGGGPAASLTFSPPVTPPKGDAARGDDHSPRNLDIVRRSLYSSHSVPKPLAEAAAAERCGMPDLSFLDHAWGKTPPAAHVAASKRLFGLYALGNTTWDVLFGEIMPEAARHVKELLGVGGDSHSVEFCHNSHEIMTRLLSSKMDRLLQLPNKQEGKEGQQEKEEGDESSPGQQMMRILTTDTEFYSLTRQLNRFKELGARSQIQIESVPIEPLATFPERFSEAAGRQCFDIVYASQCVYSTQETIVTDVPGFVTDVHSSLRQAWAISMKRPSAMFDALIVLDGYHGFGAIPTDLSTIDPAVPLCYLSGMLKHVGSGANCAFMVSPAKLHLRPLLTGWLADPSVLAPESDGLKLGSEVGYCPGLSLMGGTPAFAPALLTFNEVMRRWQERGISVGQVHAHVMKLHDRFLIGLESKAAADEQDQAPPAPADAAPAAGAGAGAASAGIRLDTLHSLLPKESRSHTLVFDQPSAADAKAVVQTLRKSHGIEIDSRKMYVRIGFGFNHNPEEVDRLLRAIGQG